MIVGRPPKPDRRPAVLAAVPPRAATAHPEAPVPFVFVSVTAPLPDVAVHVVEAEGVRLVRAHLARPLQPRPRGGPAVRHGAAKVGLAGRETVAGVENLIGRSPAATGVLPLRLARQAIRPPRPLLSGQRRQSCAELDGLAPRHVLHREVARADHVLDLVFAAARLTPVFVTRALPPRGAGREVAGVEAHDLLELLLSHLVDAQVERLRYLHLVLPLVLVAPFLVSR